MSYPVKNGQTSVVLRFKLLDSSSTTGAGLTGLTSASSSLIISTIADNEATAVAYTVAGSTIETITTLGTYAAPTATKCRFKEVDSTNHKGIYEFQFADARFAVSNAKSLLISVLGATNLAQADYVLALVSDDPYVAKPTNSSLLSIDGSGRVDVGKVLGTAQTAKDLGATLGSPAGASVSADIAAVKSDTGTILTDVNTGAGAIYTRIGAPAGASIAADIAAVNTKTTNLPASPAATGDAMTLTAGERNSVADALLDRANAIETGVTPRGLWRLLGAVMAGKLSGAGSGTEVFRNTVADSKDRITATVDVSGNRTAIVTDQT